MNPTENIGATIKNKVEELVADEYRRDRYNYDVVETNLVNTPRGLEDGTDLFINLLCSMIKRFDALEAAGGGHTRFYNFVIKLSSKQFMPSINWQLYKLPFKSMNDMIVLSSIRHYRIYDILIIV